MFLVNRDKSSKTLCDKVIKASGFNPDQTIGGTATERLVDYAQFISFVKAQDVFTKSQEFIYHLDKNCLRLDIIWAYLGRPIY